MIIGDSGAKRTLAYNTQLRLARTGLVAIAILISGCDQLGNDESDQAEEDVAIPVETILPFRRNIDAVYTGTAPIEAFADAMVIAKVGGEVEQIFVEEGDDVVAGQLLARLDGDRLRLEAQQAEANLRKLERDFERNVDLKDKNLISAGDFEKIQYEMEALKATYDLSGLEYSYTEIRAPIEGVVSKRIIKIGNTIDANAETFEVTSLEPLVSYLHIPEREYRRIAADQSVDIRVDALGNASFDGMVARVSPIVDPETGTFKITIEVSDQTRRLKPGMFGRMSIVYESRENVLQIPRSAVIEEIASSSVFSVVDGIAKKHAVVTGYSAGGNIEIVDGIGEEDEVVYVGHINLKDGARVSIINTAEISDADPQAGASSGDNPK